MLEASNNRPTKRPKPKQQALPEMAQPEYPVLEEIAERLHDRQEERIMLQQAEKQDRTLLRAKMEEYGLKKYRYKGFVIELDAPEPKAYVRKAKDDAGDDSDVRNTQADIIAPLKANDSAKVEDSTPEQIQSNVVQFFDKLKGGANSIEIETGAAETFAVDDVLIVPETPKDIALFGVLHNLPGAHERWAAFRSVGDFSDTRLRNAIEHELSGGGALEQGGVKFAWKSAPAKFWFGKLKAAGTPTLEGARLLAEVRRLMMFPAKKKASVK